MWQNVDHVGQLYCFSKNTHYEYTCEWIYEQCAVVRQTEVGGFSIFTLHVTAEVDSKHIVIGQQRWQLLRCEVQILCQREDDGRYLFFLVHFINAHIWFKRVGHLVVHARQQPHKVELFVAKSLHHHLVQCLHKPWTFSRITPGIMS